jgi:pimeloyl-ACP methyl ester carboxylesterase
MEPAIRHVLGLSPAGFHRNAYCDWAGPRSEAPVLVAVHGLTRNSRDFDVIAESLSRDYRVVCPDVVGRGQSDWLPNGALYGYPQYLADANALIARLGVEAVDWLGNSMGGLMGMMLAAMPNAPIRRLIVNDVGPFIPKAALERIGDYVRSVRRFKTLREVQIYLQIIHAPFGPMTDADWERAAPHSARPLPDGGYMLAYDPAIADAFNGPIGDLDLWAVWEKIACPILVLRGANSDLLLAETAAEMVRRKPSTTLIEFPDCGHTPALASADQIAAVRDWLATT